ncbi:uncharacterized protein LOC123563958 [Mercenaria mercenaria]|uniref:uncharacterized protein LOC123563958 n=1 Tax=Mercenaria mercenaria TaxID=6596 RepID=UPI00234E9A20|nr:uncharacterized protein LOC123563958 [Mercenaria mercenaria]XP_053392574.1 uncharacterized protein LOC123563958 [Mercenaria mercenaria]XP_053392575.1 uncharacterized protein LOC123563958 [Mercenaria mercenaria]
MPQDFCLEPCPSHSGEIVKFYCKTCNSLACPHCKSDLHTNCTDVFHLPKLSADFENSAELKDLEKNIQKAKKELGSVRGMIKKSEKHAIMLRADVTKVMKKQRDVINLRYDNLEEQVNRTIDKIYSDDNAELQKQSDKTDTVDKELTSLQADIQNTKRALQRCKLYVKSKNADKVVNSVRERLKEIKEEVVVHGYSYEPVETSARERELGLVRTEGKIKSTDITGSLLSYIHLEAKMAMMLVRELRRSHLYTCMLIIAMILLAVFDIKVHMFYILFLIAVIILMSKKCFMTEMRLSLVHLRHNLIKYLLEVCINITKGTLESLKYKNVKDCVLFCRLQEWFKQLHSRYINVKTKSNALCDITGLCFLSVKHLVAVDNRNSSVKIIDIEQQSVITELTLGGRLPFQNPWDVTKIGGDQLAVTIPHSETVCFLQLTCCFDVELISLSLTRTISVSCRCYGIVYANNKLIITSSGLNSCVKILDLDGNTLQSYSKDSGGENLFQLPYYIVISPDHKTLYVSDFHCCQVTRLSMDGNVLAVCKHSQFTELFGMTTDKTGKIYVCGWSNIFMLSDNLAEGQKLKDVVKPLNNIAYCDKTNTFCLASNQHDNITCFNKLEANEV